MIALRQTVYPVNHRIIIDLPLDFNTEKVEVIVLAIEEQQEKPNAIRKFGAGKDQIVIHDSFYEPLEDFKEYT